jgi:hypothetical protein
MSRLAGEFMWFHYKHIFVYAYQVFRLNQTRFDFFLRQKRLGVPVVVRDDDGAYICISATLSMDPGSLGLYFM